MKLFKLARKYGSRAAVVAAGAAASVSAFAVDPTDAVAALTTLQTSSTGVGPVMYGVAVTSVGILIAVKWIKRGRGAA